MNMKLNILALVMCVGQACLAQDAGINSKTDTYYPTILSPDIEQQWNVKQTYCKDASQTDYGDYWTKTYTLADEVEIDGVVYRELMEEYLGVEVVYCYLREADKRVYYKRGVGLDEMLLYDFNINIGDSIPLYENSFEYGHLTLTEISEEELYDGTIRKVYIFGDEGDEDVWIEGVGSLNGIVFREFYFYGSQEWLLCYHEDGNKLWGGETCYVNTLSIQENAGTSTTVSPNPATNFVNINCENIKNIQIFSADGKMIKNISAQSNEIQVDMNDMPSGEYFFMIETKEGTITRKVVKK